MITNEITYYGTRKTGIGYKKYTEINGGGYYTSIIIPLKPSKKVYYINGSYFPDNLYISNEKKKGNSYYNNYNNQFFPENVIYSGTRNFNVDLGLISSPITITLILKSNYTEDLTVDYVTNIAKLGMDIKGIVAGDVLPANGSYTFQVVIYNNKGYDILNDNKMTIAFTNGVKIVYNFNLQRVSGNIYSLYPNKDSYIESYIFNTSIYSTFAGNETRHTNIIEPKMKVKANYSALTMDKFNYMLSAIYKNERTAFYFPLWEALIHPNVDKLNTFDKTNTIYFNSIPYEFQSVTKALIAESETDLLILNIKGITDNSLVVEGKLNYSQNQYVVPLIEVYLDGNPTINNAIGNDNAISLSLKTL